MKQNLKNDPTKAYYKWVYYYDWNTGTYNKIEYFCVYKTGRQQSIWVFDVDDIFYVDKIKVIHYLPNLIECRLEENYMIGMYFEKLEPKLFEKPEIITRVYGKYKTIIGWNVNIGEIRYEIDTGYPDSTTNNN